MSGSDGPKTLIGGETCGSATKPGETTRRGWAIKPFPTSQYASGARLLFENDDYGTDFLQDCLDWPKTESTAAAMFNRYGDFQKGVFERARWLGIKTCIGTELPLARIFHDELG